MRRKQGSNTGSNSVCNKQQILGYNRFNMLYESFYFFRSIRQTTIRIQRRKSLYAHIAKKQPTAFKASRTSSISKGFRSSDRAKSTMRRDASLRSMSSLIKYFWARRVINSLDKKFLYNDNKPSKPTIYMT